MPQDEGLLAWVFPVGVAVACGDPGQHDVGGRAQQRDVVELGVKLALVGLAARDEQMTVPVTSQQSGDGILAPYPVRGPVRQADPVTPLVRVGVYDMMAPLTQDAQ